MGKEVRKEERKEGRKEGRKWSFPSIALRGLSAHNSVHACLERAHKKWRLFLYDLARQIDKLSFYRKTSMVTYHFFLLF